MKEWKVQQTDERYNTSKTLIKENEVIDDNEAQVISNTFVDFASGYFWDGHLSIKIPYIICKREKE